MTKYLRIVLLASGILISFFLTAQRDKYRVYITCRALGGIGINSIRCNDDSVLNTTSASVFSFSKNYDSKPSAYNISITSSAGRKTFTYSGDRSCIQQNSTLWPEWASGMTFNLSIYAPALTVPQVISGGSGIRVYEGDRVVVKTEGKSDRYSLFVGTESGGVILWNLINSTYTNQFIMDYGYYFYSVTTPLRTEDKRYGIYYLKAEPEEGYDCNDARKSDITAFILTPSKPLGTKVGDLTIINDAEELTYKTDPNFPRTFSAEWQISEDGGATWNTIATTGPDKDLTRSLDGFCKYRQKYGINRLLRYKKAGIDNQYASPSIPIKFTLSEPTGVFDSLCEYNYVSAQGVYIPSNIQWQVREEYGPWQDILYPLWGNSITIGINDLVKSRPKFGTVRYIRYKIAGTSDEGASPASPPIVFYPASASITSDNLEITPASCKNKWDGKVVVKNVVGGSPVVYVTLSTKDGGIAPDGQKYWDKSTPLVFNGIPAEEYKLQIENTGTIKSCPTNFPLTVGVKPAIRFTAIKKVDPTCRERSDGSIEVAVADGLTPREYTLYKNDGKGVWVEQKKVRPADLSYTFTTLSEGNYKVMASDGCQIVSQEVMLQNPVFRMDTLSTTPAYCGLSYGKITVQMSGGKPPYTYSWKYGAQILSTTKATAENLLPGMYTVTGTDANGCSGPPLSVEVVEGIHPTLTVGSVPTGCGLSKGIGMVEIKQGFWPYTYSWKDKAGNTLRAITRKESSDTLAHLLKGTYQVVVQDSKGCQVQTKVEITEHAPLAITILSTTPASCPQSSDGKAFIKVEGGLAPYIYEWNDAGKQTKAEAINLKSGNYTIKVTDALGCSKEQTVEVKSIPELTFSETIKPPTCYETCDAAIHVAVSGGTPPYKYMWSTGVISNTIQSLCEGIYSLTVEDAKKCVKTVSYTIVKPSELLGVLKEKEATICSGQVMALDPGEWKSYSWKNQQGNLIGQDRILKITQAGQYFLEVTNPYGCVIKDQFTLHTSTNLLEAKIIFANPQVVGDTVVLTEISLPKPETWSWTYPSQLITYEQGPAPSQQQVILSEPGTYWIRFIAGLGECRDTVIRTMTVLPKSESTNLLNQLSAVLGSKAITKLSLYPNPNSGKFTLEVILEKAAPVQIQLYGWQSTDPMYQTTFEENTIHKQELDVLGVSKGLYVVMIYVPGEKPRLIKLMIE